MLLEAIHSAGFSGALANPLIAPESAISQLDANVLEEFVFVSPSKLAFSLSKCCLLLFLPNSDQNDLSS
jgi:hypothetical protein